MPGRSPLLDKFLVCQYGVLNSGSPSAETNISAILNAFLLPSVDSRLFPSSLGVLPEISL